MTTKTTLALLRIGSAKDLTKSAVEGDLKEGLTSQQYFI